MYENLKKMSMKAKKKLENANFFFGEVCLMGLAEAKIIVQTVFATNIVSQNCAKRFKLTGIGVEIWSRYY